MNNTPVPLATINPSHNNSLAFYVNQVIIAVIKVFPHPVDYANQVFIAEQAHLSILLLAIIMVLILVECVEKVTTVLLVLHLCCHVNLDIIAHKSD